jgi:prolyl-tRNA synthetase
MVKSAHKVTCFFAANQLLLSNKDSKIRKLNMRLTRYFLPILRDTPKEAEIMSHRLMLRAGMIRQHSAGIYSWLPLGLRVLEKINAIIIEEQNRAGAIEIKMPTIQSADLWRESGRYEAYGAEMLRITDRHKREMLFGPTNEEMVTDIFRGFVKSYKSLPLNLYHIQWKFRDEVRPRFGVMRSREFLMKDAYSFDIDEKSAGHSYNKMFVAYLRTFERLGLKSIPMKADTGPIGGDLSHEFIILASTGESQVFCHKDFLDYDTPPLETDFNDVGALQAIVDKWTGLYAATEDMHDAPSFDALPQGAKLSARGIEVGHIFYFGTKYSTSMKAEVSGADGKMVPVHMGSYGIGPSRLVAAIIEASHDERGIIWPRAIAPFEVAILNLKAGDATTDAACEQLYARLNAAGIDTLYDDTD